MIWYLTDTNISKSITKPLRNNHPPSDRIPYAMAIIPCNIGISKKLCHIENCYNIRTIFKTKYKIGGAIMSTS